MSAKGSWLLLCGLWAQAAGAADGGPTPVEPISFSSRAAPAQVRLGEPFTYELVLTHEPQERYEVTPPAELGAFELLGQQRSRVDRPGQATTTFRLTLALYELGKQTIPDLPFEVQRPSGAGLFVAKGIEVEALGSLPADADQKGATLYDLKDLEQVPVRTYRLLGWLAGVLGGLALGYVLYRYLKRARAPKVVVAPQRPLRVRTLEALEALRAEDLPARARTREFHFRLSEILRAHLGERFDFEALECTSYELLTRLDPLEAQGLPRQAFREFLEQSDLVKFAKAEASAAQCQQALEFGFRLVQQTAPESKPEAASDVRRAQLP